MFRGCFIGFCLVKGHGKTLNNLCVVVNVAKRVQPLL